MYAFKLSTLAVLATMCTAAFATPAAPLEARDDTANVRMFSGDTCGDAEQSFSVSGSGAYRCVPVSAARRSILVTGSGCTTTTWSGTNCEGSRYKIPDSGCHSLLYGSVSVQC